MTFYSSSLQNVVFVSNTFFKKFINRKRHEFHWLKIIKIKIMTIFFYSQGDGEEINTRYQKEIIYCADIINPNDIVKVFCFSNLSIRLKNI